MREFKVLLIHANSQLDTLIPPNLAIISACLKKEEMQVKLFDTTFYKTREVTGDEARANTLQIKRTSLEEYGIHLNRTDMYEDFLKLVEEYKPSIVGLSAIELTYPFGIKFLEKLKQKHPKIPTIVGGIHSTVSPEEVIDEQGVDFVCVGEGEIAFARLCKTIRDGGNTTKIGKIWSKNNGKIIRNPVGQPTDMDSVPFQDWDIFDEKRIYRPMGGKIRRVGCFALTRGCPYSCTYCCNDFLHKLYTTQYYRESNIRRFIEEVKHMKEKYKLDYVYVSANSFLVTKKGRFEEFIKQWKERIKLPFWVETRPESITEEKAKLLEDAGCVSVSIGVESGSPKIRKMLNRHMTNEQIGKAFEILKKTKMRICANSIIGFPEETREQVFETIELNREIKVDNIMIHVFNAYRGTSLFNICIEKGYLCKKSLGGDYRTDAILKMPQLSPREILGLQRTFALYVKLPKERWHEIRIAEKFDKEGNKKFEELKLEYTKKFLDY